MLLQTLTTILITASTDGGKQQAVPQYSIPAITATATIISCLVTVAFNWWIFGRSRKSQEKRMIQDMIDKTIDYSIEYPYFENDEFCSKWKGKNLADEAGMRYDSYCCFVFNMLERLWDHANGDRKIMEAVLHVDELIARHSTWWNAESDNRLGYADGFRTFVVEVLNQEDVRRHLNRVAQSNSH